MENESGAPYTSTVMAALEEWNSRERIFKQVFSEAAAGDREFLKIKLSEYDNIYLRHSQNAQSRDERAMLAMLRYQRHKLERVLYPSLLARIGRKVYIFLRPAVDGKREMDLARKIGLQQDSIKQIRIPAENQEKTSSNQQAENNHSQERKPYYRQNLGWRKANHPKKGLRM